MIKCRISQLFVCDKNVNDFQTKFVFVFVFVNEKIKSQPLFSAYCKYPNGQVQGVGGRRVSRSRGYRCVQ